MSAFTESALIKKLVDLNPSQQSIQTLSLWLIHHRKHHSNIVKSWYKEMQKAIKNKKLTFMYLANDVIQNSKKKGPEYGKEFKKVLLKAFLHIGETCSASDDKTISSLDRILKILEDRMVYDAKPVQGFRDALHKNDSSHSPKAEPTEKRKRDDEPRKEMKRHKNRKHDGWNREKERIESETVEVNGTVETHVIFSPQAPAEPEELIRALMDLENSTSSDDVVLEQIANLPPEVSEVAMLSKLEDKEQAAKLVAQVNEAAKILNEYNNRLCVEMEDRKKLTTMLKDFQIEQRDLLAQAEQRLKLKIQFNETLTSIFEYPSENSLLAEDVENDMDYLVALH